MRVPPSHEHFERISQYASVESMKKIVVYGVVCFHIRIIPPDYEGTMS